MQITSFKSASTQVYSTACLDALTLSLATVRQFMGQDETIVMSFTLLAVTNQEPHQDFKCVGHTLILHNYDCTLYHKFNLSGDCKPPPLPSSRGQKKMKFDEFMHIYMYMCICIYICIYTSPYAFLQRVCMHSQVLLSTMHVQVCTLNRCCEYQRTHLVHARWKMCICAIYTHVYIHMYMYICMCMHVYIYVYIYICIYVYIYICI